MPGPQPRSLLRDTHPDVFLEAVRIVGSGAALTTLWHPEQPPGHLALQLVRPRVGGGAGCSVTRRRLS